MKSTRLLVACAWVLVLPNINRAQHATITACPADSVQHWLKRYHVPGAAIGIIENNQIKSIGYYGDIRPGIPVSQRTLWNIASLTKPVTAATVMNIVNTGQLRLDEPVYLYYTDPDIKNDPRSKELTPRIFLSHQTGFKNWPYMEPDHKLHFHYDPGKGYGYSGMGYEYMRHAVENKLGMNLQQLAAKYVFTRAGMTNTYFGWNNSLDSNRFAWAYANDGKRYNYIYNGANAADWLMTSMADYCRFGVFVMNREGISEKLFADVTRIQVHMDNAHSNDGMGLGWEVIRDLPHEEYVMTHSGSDNGVATIVLLFPKSKRGIVVFTNGDGGSEFISKVLKASRIDLARELAPSMNEFN